MLKESSEILNNQAIMLASKGEYDEAIACFKRALTMETQNYLLWFNLGITFRDSGDIETAKIAMKKALALNPSDDEIIETLALLCFNNGDFDEALQYCSMGLHANQDNFHLWNTLGVIYFNQSIYKDACFAFEQALSLNPYYYEALYNLRDTYEELHNKIGVEECNRKLEQNRKK